MSADRVVTFTSAFRRVTFANADRARNKALGHPVMPRSASNRANGGFVRIAVLVLATLLVGACTSTPVETPAPTAQPTAAPTVAPTDSPEPSPSDAPIAGKRRRVDVANGPRPVIVQIQTGSGIYAWLVAAGEHSTLLDEDQGTPGYLWVLEPPTASRSCGDIGDDVFGKGTITIVLGGPAAGVGYTVKVVNGATASGPARTDYTPACSG
jgi:hypothetical protein